VGSGDIDVEWKSRNRHNKGATNFLYADAISEDLDFSTFRLEIYEGENLLRTIDLTTKTYSYTGALQIEDGGPFASYTMKIYQISTTKISTEYGQVDITVV
jgi:prepilin-type processing-associated H-X9-DG protein